MKDGGYQVLLVEDEEVDVRLAQRAFDRLEAPVEVSVTGTGEEALSFLRKSQGYLDAPNVDLVLLDINLPKKDGKEVLAEVKSDPALRQTVVIMLTSSEAEGDVKTCYDLGANGYICKPVAPSAIVTAVKAIRDFWFSVAKLPPKAKSC